MSPPVDFSEVDRLPPHSIEAEQGLIGCVLQEPITSIPRVRALLPAGEMTFYDLRHQTLYEQIQGMERDGIAVDLITLHQRLRDKNVLEAIGGLAYLTGLMDSVGGAANLDYYAAILVEKFTRRQIIQEASQLVSDAFDESKDDEELTRKAVRFLKDRSKRGASSGLFTMAEIEPHYSERCHQLGKVGLRLSRWLPSLDTLRVLVPGNMILVLANTGVGKTALLSNLALAAAPMPTLFLQLELPKEDIFERILATKSGTPCGKIEHGYSSTDKIEGKEFHDSRFPGLVVSEEPKLTIEDVRSKIYGMELKLGVAPKLVLLDYMGLMRGSGQGRYDKFSQIAEDLRVLAKETDTIVVAASQIGRKKDDDDPEVGLHDGKESGSLENSASLVLGAWRNPEKPEEMHLRVLKCNKGGSGTHVICNYDLNTLKITEQTRGNYGHEND